MSKKCFELTAYGLELIADSMGEVSGDEFNKALSTLRR